MPWCPHCKEEYRDGFTVCAECGEKLVDELPKQAVQVSGFTPGQEVELRLLTYCADNIESKMVQGLLRDEDIPFVLKDSGQGRYLGDSVFGLEFYVSERDYARAKELIDLYLAAASGEEYSEEEQTYESDEDGDPGEKSGMSVVKLIGLLLLGAAIMWVFYMSLRDLLG